MRAGGENRKAPPPGQKIAGRKSFRALRLSIRLEPMSTWNERTSFRALRVSNRGRRMSNWVLRVSNWGRRMSTWALRVSNWVLRVSFWVLRMSFRVLRVSFWVHFMSEPEQKKGRVGKKMSSEAHEKLLFVL